MTCLGIRGIFTTNSAPIWDTSLSLQPNPSQFGTCRVLLREKRCRGCEIYEAWPRGSDMSHFRTTPKINLTPPCGDRTRRTSYEHTKEAA